MKMHELAEKIENADCWDYDDCRALCEMVGLGEEWEKADGENFESVVFCAIEIAKKESEK